MFLAVDRDEQRDVQHDRQLDLAIFRWRHRPASVLLHHGKTCCAVAREWVFATDFSQLNGEHEQTGPRWIRARHKWGPSKWPMSWCEAVEQKTLDCGALSAISRAVFEARGITAYPAQLIQVYSEQSGRHWSNNWNAEDAPSDWVMNGLAYHEACAVVTDESVLKIWDPSIACWIGAPDFYGYGSVLALRIVARPIHSAATFCWATNEILCNQWQKIYPASDSIAPSRIGVEAIQETIALEKQMPQLNAYRYETGAGGD